MKILVGMLSIYCASLLAFAGTEDIEAAKELARSELVRKVERVVSRECGASCGEFRVDLFTGLVSERSGFSAPGFESVGSGPKRQKITRGRITLLVEEGYSAERLVAEVKAAATQVVDFPVAVQTAALGRPVRATVSADFLAWARTLIWPLTFLLLVLLSAAWFFLARWKGEQEAPQVTRTEEAAPPALADLNELARVVEVQRDDLRFWLEELSVDQTQNGELDRLAHLCLFLPDLSSLGLSPAAWKSLAQTLESGVHAEEPTQVDFKWLQLQLARARIRRLAAHALPAEKVRHSAIERKVAWMRLQGGRRMDEACAMLFLTDEDAWPRLLAPLLPEERIGLLHVFHQRVGNGELESIVARVASGLTADLSSVEPVAERDWMETLSRFVTQAEASRAGMSVHGAPSLGDALRSLPDEKLRELCFEMDLDALSGVWEQASAEDRKRLRVAMPAGLRSRVESRANDLRVRMPEMERRRVMLEAQAGISQYLWKQGMLHEAQA